MDTTSRLCDVDWLQQAYTNEDRSACESCHYKTFYNEEALAPLFESLLSGG